MSLFTRVPVAALLASAVLSFGLSTPSHARAIYAGMEGQGSYNVPARCKCEDDVGKHAIGNLPSVVPERGTNFYVISLQDGFTVRMTTLLYQCEKIVSDVNAPVEFWWNTVPPPPGHALKLIPHKNWSFGKGYLAELTSQEIIVPSPEEGAVQTTGEITLPFSAALTSSEISYVLNGGTKHKRFDVRVPVPESRSRNYLFYVDVRFEQAEDGKLRAVLQ